MKNNRSLYLPGLNGLRAISALAVVVSHIIFFSHLHPNSAIHEKHTGLELATYGVTIFFTLSGFLITYILLKEKEIAQINVGNFYIRRVLRIWPLYYGYLFLIIILLMSFHVAINKIQLVFYIFLVPNIPFVFKLFSPLIYQLWSIGVEEQFYLFFPWLARLSNRRLLSSILSLLAIWLCIKAGFYFLNNLIPLRVMQVTRFDTMLIGVLAAILFYDGNKRFINMVTNKLMQLAAWLCLGLVTINKFNVSDLINHEIISLAAAIIIVGQISNRNKIINLETPLLNFIGRISYGIYIIHPLVIFTVSTIFNKVFNSNSIGVTVLFYIVVLTCTILFSKLSYGLFETKFLNIKERFATVPTTS